MNQHGLRFFLTLVLAFATFISLSAFAVSQPALPEHVLPLPLVEQATEYSCGAAAFLSVAKYWQKFNGAEEDLYPILHTTPRDGTHPRRMEWAGRHFGLRSELREHMEISDLQDLLDQKATVILDIQAWPDDENHHPPWSRMWEDGHYVVLIGLDSDYAYFMDPSAEDGYAYVGIDELMARWHDYEIEGPQKRPHRYYQAGIIYRGDNPITTAPSTRAISRMR